MIADEGVEEGIRNASEGTLKKTIEIWKIKYIDLFISLITHSGKGTKANALKEQVIEEKVNLVISFNRGEFNFLLFIMHGDDHAN